MESSIVTIKKQVQEESYQAKRIQRNRKNCRSKNFGRCLEEILSILTNFIQKIMTDGVQEGEDQTEKYQLYCASMGLKTDLLRANKTHDM